jgi:hypothetical protein
LSAVAVGGPGPLAEDVASGLKALGSEAVKGLRFVCSDMWKPYLDIIAA